MTVPPKHHAAPSVFRPEHLLAQARRQRGLPDQPVPALCVLDPDGDLVRALRHAGRAAPAAGWACYHTTLDVFALPDGTQAGVLGCAVGAPFAVLVAEQLFASGCRCLLSITSAGQVADLGPGAAVVLIDRAIRDEGTSLHYLPASPDGYVSAPHPALLAAIEARLRDTLAPTGVTIHRGATWTTDAPYRETAAAIAHAAGHGALAVEMEAAALYAFAVARGRTVVCVAHVTNTMGRSDGNDFEKGEAGGSLTALAIIEATAQALAAEARAAAG